MKVMIMTDMEGLSGVDTMEMISETESDGHRIARERLMLDLNAAVEGAFDGGATEVYVEDGHGTGKNFIKEMLDKRAVQLNPTSWNEKVRNGEIDAYMEVGCHAMAGTFNGFLDHTQSSKAWYNYIVNGRKCGEIAQGAIFIGAFDVPFVMVTGDEAACVEAKAFLGDVECAVVKYGIGRNRAKLICPDKALDIIREAAKNGMEKINTIRPYKPVMPLEIVLEYYRSDMCDDAYKRLDNVERVDARTLRKMVTKINSYRDILF